METYSPRADDRDCSRVPREVVIPNQVPRLFWDKGCFSSHSPGFRGSENLETTLPRRFCFAFPSFLFVLFWCCEGFVPPPGIPHTVLAGYHVKGGPFILRAQEPISAEIPSFTLFFCTPGCIRLFSSGKLRLEVLFTLLIFTLISFIFPSIVVFVH